MKKRVYKVGHPLDGATMVNATSQVAAIQFVFPHYAATVATKDELIAHLRSGRVILEAPEKASAAACEEPAGGTD